MPHQVGLNLRPLQDKLYELQRYDQGKVGQRQIKGVDQQRWAIVTEIKTMIQLLDDTSKQRVDQFIETSTTTKNINFIFR